MAEHVRPRTLKEIPWVKYNLKRPCERCGRSSKHGRGYHLYNDVVDGKKVCIYCAKKAGM